MPGAVYVEFASPEHCYIYTSDSTSKPYRDKVGLFVLTNYEIRRVAQPVPIAIRAEQDTSVFPVFRVLVEYEWFPTSYLSDEQ